MAQHIVLGRFAFWGASRDNGRTID
jgi:hypothetical protein